MREVFAGDAKVEKVLGLETAQDLDLDLIGHCEKGFQGGPDWSFFRKGPDVGVTTMTYCFVVAGPPSSGTSALVLERVKSSDREASEDLRVLGLVAELARRVVSSSFIVACVWDKGQLGEQGAI